MSISMFTICVLYDPPTSYHRLAFVRSLACSRKLNKSLVLNFSNKVIPKPSWHSCMCFMYVITLLCNGLGPPSFYWEYHRILLFCFKTSKPTFFGVPHFTVHDKISQSSILSTNSKNFFDLNNTQGALKVSGY